MFVSSTIEAEPVWIMGMESLSSFAIPSSTSPARNITIPTAIRPEPEKGGIAAGPLAGIVVGSVVIGLLVIGIIVFFLIRRRRRRAEQAAVKEKPKPDPRQKRRVWI
jgi:cbb3-type cytochrome oxidase subunit 3